MTVEVAKGIEVESITLRRDQRGAKAIVMHLKDGRHIELGTIGQAFTQTHFRTVMTEHGITTCKRPLMQWDAFTISLMQKAQHGGA